MRSGPIAAAAAGLALAAAVVPGTALAHGLAVREDIPLPTWIFVWGAALVLIVSFVALATLWPEPRLQQDSWRPLPDRLSRILTSRPLEILCGAIGVFLLWLVVWTGLRGETTAQSFAPVFVYITFWLGLLPVSVLFGDVFRAFNPWRAAARGVGWVARQAAGGELPPVLSYPEKFGRWPAVVGVFLFGWLELAAAGGDTPDTVATATLIYSTLTWLGMALYGSEAWTARGETFSVYFNLISRLSVFERRGRQIGVRRFLSGLAHWEPAPGSVALVTTLIGVVSFDGFSTGATWNTWLPDLQAFWESLGFSTVRALEATFGSGLIAAVLLTYGFYRLGVAGARRVGGGYSSRQLASSFAHSLAPIALVYAAAHYVSFFLLQGQSIIPIASDPFGTGADYFGTADVVVDYGLIGAEAFWYMQVGFVVTGHVAGLILAHDRAISIYSRPEDAVRSQYWLLLVMIGFTTLALWLLSEVSG